MPELIEINGKSFTATTELPSSNWSCVISDRPITTLTLKDDDLFLITDTLGNISGAGCRSDSMEGSMGLFCRDTRFLSRLELQIEGRSPVPFSSNAHQGFAMSILCANPQIEALSESLDGVGDVKGNLVREADQDGLKNPFPSNTENGSEPIIKNNVENASESISEDKFGSNLGTTLGDPAVYQNSPTPKVSIPAETLGILRRIIIKGGLFEEIQVTNHNTKPVDFVMSLSFDADFADLFEVRGVVRTKRGKFLQYIPNTEGNIKEIILAYQGLDGIVMESQIHFRACLPDEIKDYTALWHLHLEAGATVTLGYRLHLFTNGHPTSTVSAPSSFSQAQAEELLEEKIWREGITQIQTDNKYFNQVINKAVQDIYLLRQTFDGNHFLAAGVPWFSTLFGRDSLIAASQTLILDPTIAKETLQVLARYQGKTENEWRDEQPGKILHELRLGEMSRCHEVPHTPYYGTVDATPLWLMLYAEYFAWTGDLETLEQLWDHALAAMDWVDRNCQDTGYLSYSRKSTKGLINQGWKDSGNCVVNRRGELAQGAIALSEVQAYVYAAKVRMGELAEKRGLTDLANLWCSQALDLKIRFNQDFWLPDQEYYALALDGEGKPVDSITSNAGQCLNFGILDPEKALKVAARLKAPDMFTGWGIRTLSSLSPAYNPMGYHVGSVWPHDSSLIAAGLRSFNLVDQALSLAQGLVDMTLAQPYQRPPELFCGYEHDGFSTPVQYPVACSPQAWATGSIFQLITMMVNLVPNAPSQQLRIIDPALITSIGRLSIKNLRIGSSVIDLEFERAGDRSSDTVACRVVKKQGNLRVIIEA
jgi:glycogen debranching enzyme